MGTRDRCTLLSDGPSEGARERPREGLPGLLAWRRTRFSHWLFIPASLTLMLAGVAAGPRLGQGELILRVALAWGLLLALRLWDDLEDRKRDAQSHPERVLVCAQSLAPFRAAVVVLLLAGLLLTGLSLGLFSAAVLVLLLLCLLVVYRLGLNERSGGALLVLLKYPAVVLLFRGGLDLEGGCAMALVYGGMCLDEGLETAGPIALVPLSLASLGLLWLLRVSPPAMLALLLLVLAGGSLLALLGRGKSAPWTGSQRATALILTVLQLLLLDFGRT